VIPVRAVAYFAAKFLGQQMKLRVLCEKLLIISQRFFGILTLPEKPPASLQLELSLGWEA